MLGNPVSYIVGTTNGRNNANVVSNTNQSIRSLVAKETYFAPPFIPMLSLMLNIVPQTGNEDPVCTQCSLTKCCVLLYVIACNLLYLVITSFSPSLPNINGNNNRLYKARFQCHFNTTPHCLISSMFSFVQLLYVYQLHYNGFGETVNAVIPCFEHHNTTSANAG